MKTTRTTIALLVAAALAMTWAAPVSAARPVKTEIVKVTMTLVNGQGLATDCPEVGGSILMIRDRAGLVGADDGLLRLVMDEVTWERQYPPMDGPVAGFDGCHGDTVEGSPVVNDTYGGLGINIDRNGAVTDVLWHFDYYLDGEEIQLNPRKTRFVWTVREYFTLTGNDLNWDDETSTVSGWFYLKHSLYDALNEIGYRPFGSPQWLEFTLTYEPLP